MKFRFSRKGDTLIEVLLAIGIFSMVAIAVVSVVSGSTSSAQSALELTLTREEIDAQAEAIRFIHSSYMAGGNTNLAGNTTYRELWNYMIEGAKLNIDDYAPATCEEIYEYDKEENKSLVSQSAFIINTHNMGLGSANIIIKAQDNNVGEDKLFDITQTYPQIYYGNNNNNDSLLANSSLVQNNITGVKGLFVIPVKDNESTLIVDKSGTVEKTAYYDFYIRSCWFGPGADRPSTISTVIRLMDPSAINYSSGI
ncbi:hypothetical protein IJG04_01205 [Candidatus Saccharibacteria bacterium]|nr:hypothetical protein [Candidatus Saccharibacteria bacterium]